VRGPFLTGGSFLCHLATGAFLYDGLLIKTNLSFLITFLITAFLTYTFLVLFTTAFLATGAFLNFAIDEGLGIFVAIFFFGLVFAIYNLIIIRYSI
jgi:hypothetical protein